MRPIRQITTFLIELFLWCILCIFQLDFQALSSLATAQKKLEEQPMWVFVLFFGLMVVMAADQLKKTKFTAADFWGSQGIETFFDAPKRIDFSWLLIAVLATGIGLWIASSLSPYYFTQDDNFSQFMPGILVGCRAVWQGHFANWNPYQMLGAPLADVGTYALTYPPTYFSYWVARNLFHDEQFVVDVFCWLHLLMASAVTFVLARRMRLWGPMAAAVAVCFSLSGYALIAGRSWYYMTPAMFWIPLLILMAVRFSPAEPTWIWTIWTGLSIGVFYHSGNVQMWVYGLGFFVLLLLLRKPRENWAWDELARCLPALLIGVGLALPLLIPQWKATAGLKRLAGGEGIERGLMSLLYPNPLVNSGMPNGWGMDIGAPAGQLYYAGTLLTLAWVAGLAVLVAGRDGVKAFRGNPILSASLIAFLLSLGSKGGLWVLHMQLPLLKSFAQPFKFLPFVHLFSLLLGALILQRAFARSNKQFLAGVGLFVVSMLIMFYHASIASQAFYVWKDRPAQTVPSAMIHAIGNERIYPLAPWRSPVEGFARSMSQNLASVAGVQSVEGYEPLWRNKPPYSVINDGMVDQMAVVLRRYGVTKLVVHSSAQRPVLSQNKGVNGSESLPAEWVKQALQMADGDATYQDEAVAVYRVSGAEPLARMGVDAMPLTIEGNEVVVNTAAISGGGKLMVNYLWRPGIIARTGDTTLPVSPDEFSRLEIAVPQGTQRVLIGYRVDWGTSMLAGVVVMLLGALSWKMAIKD